MQRLATFRLAFRHPIIASHSRSFARFKPAISHRNQAFCKVTTFQARSMAGICSWVCGRGRALPPVDTLDFGTYDAETIAYVKGIYQSAEFRRNPQRYMERWREKRGHTEEFRKLEDPAIQIIGDIVDK